MNLFTHHESNCAAIVDRMPTPVAAVFAPDAQANRLRKAANLYRIYTGERYYLDLLFGPVRATSRAHILSELRGEKVAKSKAGWELFRRELCAALKIDATKMTIAAMETEIGKRMAGLLFARPS